MRVHGDTLLTPPGLIQRFVACFAAAMVALVGSSFLLELLAAGLSLSAEPKLDARARMLLFAVRLAFMAGAFVALLPSLTGSHRRLWVAPLTQLCWLGAAAFHGGDWLGSRLTEGDFVKTQSWAPLLRDSVGPGAVALCALLGLFVSLCARPRWGWLLRALGVLAAAGAVTADVRLFPGLYPEAHLALLVLSSLLIMASLGDALAPWLARRSPLVSLAALALIAAGVGAQAPKVWPPERTVLAQLVARSPRALPLFDTVLPRFESHEIFDRLATLDLSPMKPERKPKQATAALPANTNVVLIVVDAMRADTVPPAREAASPRLKRFTEADTPFLSGLVRRGYRFRRAYSAAAQTHLSMPSLLGSREAYDPPATTSLTLRMQELGKDAYAIVPQYFVERAELGARDLLSDFSEVLVYPRTEQKEWSTLAHELIPRIAQKPFFLWMHYYALHLPGYAGHYDTAGADRWEQGYREALRWVDMQVRLLMAELEQAGVADRTLVVLTSDHGEGLRDDGFLTHGPSVADPATRVPLTFVIPGRPGGEIPATVGNIDVVPTLLALFGQPVPRELRGRSLAPLLEDPEAAWDQSYYAVSAREGQHALVRGAQKHVYAKSANLHMHYDLDRDPIESEDILSVRLPEHRAMLDELVERRPDLFTADLERAETKALLDRVLGEIDPAHPPAALPFLLELIRRAPSDKRMKWAVKVFEASDDPFVRATVLAHLASWGKRRELERSLSTILTRSRGSSEETALLGALSAAGVKPIAPDALADSLKAAIERKADLAPWLELLRDWNLPARRFAPLLGKALAASAHAGSRTNLRMTLEAIAMLQGLSEEERTHLAGAVRGLLEGRGPTIEARACAALGALRDPEAAEALQRRAEGGTTIVRVHALEALARIAPEPARMIAESWLKDSSLAMTGVHILGVIRSPESRPALDAVIREPKNGDVLRSEARRIRGQLPKPEVVVEKSPENTANEGREAAGAEKAKKSAAKP